MSEPATKPHDITATEIAERMKAAKSTIGDSLNEALVNREIEALQKSLIPPHIA